MGVKGLSNAYCNQLQWRAKHDLQDEVGDQSFLGMNSWGAKLQGIWSHAVFPFALAKGFVFGEDKQTIPLVDVPDALKNTQWAKDVQTFSTLKQEEIDLRAKSVEYQVGGILTLNLGKFNDGRAMGKAIEHDRAKQVLVLPARSSVLRDEGERVADGRANPTAPEIQLPNVPRDVVRTVQRS